MQFSCHCVPTVRLVPNWCKFWSTKTQPRTTREENNTALAKLFYLQEWLQISGMHSQVFWGCTSCLNSPANWRPTLPRQTLLLQLWKPEPSIPYWQSLLSNMQICARFLLFAFLWCSSTQPQLQRPTTLCPKARHNSAHSPSIFLPLSTCNPVHCLLFYTFWQVPCVFYSQGELYWIFRL